MLSSLFKNLRWLSIEVALGALACGYMVAYVLEVKMPWTWWIALPLSVWVIYTIDHLIDAFRLQENASTERHQFHHKNFDILVLITILGIVTCGVIGPFFMPIYMVRFGIGMMILTVIHLVILQFVGEKNAIYLGKEWAVGIIYTLGVLGGPLSMRSLSYLVSLPEGFQSHVVIMLALAFQFFCIVMMNLLIFSYYEIERDKKDKENSWVLAIGVQNTAKVVTTLLFLSLATSIFIFTQHANARVLQAEVTLLLMAFATYAILYFKQYFVLDARYRLWGDMIFLLPFWLLVLG